MHFKARFKSRVCNTKKATCIGMVATLFSDETQPKSVRYIAHSHRTLTSNTNIQQVKYNQTRWSRSASSSTFILSSISMIPSAFVCVRSHVSASSTDKSLPSTLSSIPTSPSMPSISLILLFISFSAWAHHLLQRSGVTPATRSHSIEVDCPSTSRQMGLGGGVYQCTNTNNTHLLHATWMFPWITPNTNLTGYTTIQTIEDIMKKLVDGPVIDVLMLYVALQVPPRVLYPCCFRPVWTSVKRNEPAIQPAHPLYHCLQQLWMLYSNGTQQSLLKLINIATSSVQS